MSKSIDEMAEDKISEAKAEVIAAISETMDLYGVTPSVGRLYATLYLNDQMTLNEMRDELNMSKPSMSIGIRKLQKYGMVKRKYEKGSREHRYIAETKYLYGVTPSVCRLYATLYLNDQMTLNEMRDELNMSKASKSTSIRKLQKYCMVKRKYEKGSREHTYIAEKNFFRSFMSFY